MNTIRPAIDGKYFKPAPWHKTHILAFHATTSIISGYGGKEIPPFSRTFIGGEQDVRGFEIWGITPIAFIASEASVNVLNNDGSRAYPEGGFAADADIGAGDACPFPRISSLRRAATGNR